MTQQKARGWQKWKSACRKAVTDFVQWVRATNVGLMATKSERGFGNYHTSFGWVEKKGSRDNLGAAPFAVTNCYAFSTRIPP
jgi:hypothetical protein